MPTSREDRIASIERIIAALYDLAERVVSVGLRQTTVDGQTHIYRSHDEVLKAIRKYEQQLRWARARRGRRVLVSPPGEPNAGNDPEGSRSGQ